MTRSSMVPGLFFILGGVLLALVPHLLLPVCDHMVETASGGSLPMKCFWTARAELGAGGLVAFAGILHCLCTGPGARSGIAAMTAGAALLAMAFPTVLIGVCPSETMPCRMGTLPALLVIGGMVLATALVSWFRLRHAERREEGQ